MSLVYLLTSLPALELGTAPPLSRATFAEMVRDILAPRDRLEVEQALLLDEVAETVSLRFRTMVHQPLDEKNSELGEIMRHRALEADRKGNLMPPWILKERPLHLMARYWFQKAYSFSHSAFMRDYVRMWLNLEEMIAGCLCKQEGMDHAAFMLHMEGGFDSTWKVMVQSWDQADLGLSSRLRNFDYVRETLQMDDLLEMERRFDELRWKLIDRCLGPDPFSIDQVLAYFFRLRLVERVAARDAEAGRAFLDEILELKPEKTS